MMQNPHSMMNKKILSVLLIAFATFFASMSIAAKDITDEQYQVRMAQKEFDSANQDYEVLSGSIKELEKRIAQQTQQLNELKKSQPAKEERLKKAQNNLNEKQLILDKVWEENKK
jgi:peptidoglycan hydrolase CwlO-like protein